MNYNNIKLHLGRNITISLDDENTTELLNIDPAKLDLDNNSVTEISVSNLLEFLNPYHSIGILSEWQRVLKPGGKLVLEVLNIESLCVEFATTNNEQERIKLLDIIYNHNATVTDEEEFRSPLFGWWPQSIWDHLVNSGFENISIDSAYDRPYYLVAQASKPVLQHSDIDHDWLKTNEPILYGEIFERNEYDLQDNEIANKVVIDIGANAGLFSLRCVELGASKIIAVEAQPTTYQKSLVPNTKNYPSITTLNLAAYDTDDQQVYIPNHSTSSVVSNDTGEPVSTITLETLLNRLDIRGENLVLKLDCEGSEFNVLLNSSRDLLRRFSIIYAELHSNMNPNPHYHNVALLRNHLTECGFILTRSLPMYWFPDNAPPSEMGIYLEKYMRQEQ